MSKITIKNDTAPTTPESGSTALYVDSTTKKLHSLDDAGVDTEYGTGGGGGGSGDVVGPAVATDNAVARYDTVTGKLIQDSAVIIDDSGNMSGVGTLNTRNLATDASKLDGIEASATADQTGAEIKVAYELEANTNAFTDAEKTLLGNQSGTNTGDQTDVTGNSGTTDALNSATTVIDVSAATAPTTGQILTATSGTAATWQDPAAGGSTVEVTYLKDVKTAASFGGTFNNGAWRTRDLNTLTGATGSVSLSSNQITLTAGTYHIEATAPAANVNGHQTRFENITDTVTEILGSSEYSGSASNAGTMSRCTGVVTVASTKVYEFQHRCQTSAGSFGYGLSANFSVNTIYAQVKITKIS